MPEPSGADHGHDAGPGPGHGEPSAPGADGPRHAAPAETRDPGAGWSPAPTGRRAAHRRAAEPGTGAHRRATLTRALWSILLAAVLVVAVVLVVGAVTDDGNSDSDGDGNGNGNAAESTGPADPAVPAALLTWLDTALPAGATVTTSSALRTALLAAGADPELLLTSPTSTAPSSTGPATTGPATGDPGVPALLLTDTQPEGSRLLARFDPADGSGPLLVVDPHPVDPTPAEVQRRESLAAAILANPLTRADADTSAVLRTADVDQRLLTVIAGLTARAGLGLAGFPRAGGEEAGEAPVRQVLVDALGTRQVPQDAAATRELQAYLDAQLAPLAPDDVEVTGDGVLIGYDYVPGPDALVSAAAD